MAANDMPAEEREFADRFKRQYSAREARRSEQRASRVRELQAAHRQLMAERSARPSPAADPLLMPEEGSESPQETLALPDPSPYSRPPAAPSATARVAKANTTRAATQNWERGNSWTPNAEDARAAVAETTDPTNPLGIPSAEALNMDVPVPYAPAKTGLDALPPPKAHGKAPVYGGRSPVPGWNLPPESGTLPGEEQVTSMDVFKRLKPHEQAAIRHKYERGSHAHADSFEDYLGLQYGDMPPDAREAAMRAEYGSPEEMSPTARARRDAGKPLPEGLKPGYYAPDQARTMSRNIHSPEVPMAPSGGTFTHNADGSVSSRAPEDFRLQDAAKAAEYYGEGSPEHNRALAKGYGIDVTQYDISKPEDRALLAADVAREKERHDRLGEKYDVVRTPMGGTRYKANPQKMAEARDKRELAMPPERKAEFARTIMERHAGLITPEQVASLETFLQTPDGFAQMRALNQKLGRIRAMEGGRSWRQKQLNYAMTQQMANPNYAPGMAVRSLMEAVNSRDPMRVAAAFAVMGNQQGAQGAMNLAGREREAAAAVAAAEAAERAKQPKPADPVADQLGKEMQAALQRPAEERYDAIMTIVAKNQAFATMTPQERDAKVKNIMAGHEYRTIGANSPALQNHLQSLRNNREAFMAFVTSPEGMGLSREQAESMYTGVNTMTAQQAAAAGAAAAQGIGNWAQRQTGWLGGFFGLNGQGGAPPQGPR